MGNSYYHIPTLLYLYGKVIGTSAYDFIKISMVLIGWPADTSRVTSVSDSMALNASDLSSHLLKSLHPSALLSQNNEFWLVDYHFRFLSASFLRIITCLFSSRKSEAGIFYILHFSKVNHSIWYSDQCALGPSPTMGHFWAYFTLCLFVQNIDR